MHREEIKALIREVLAEVFSEKLPVSDDGLQDTRTAWKTLGYPSYDAMYKDVRAGLLREGKEVLDRRKPGAKIARWVVDIAAAKARLAQPPDQRRSI
ncbi:hypothetical protein HNI00_21950 [Thermoleptolyngbya oregonensis NK1-22]|uniref:Uncharacterized protein n=1 Tax=Thermoleptolyngbya oregonensis NK1-22 TaxID=2547457 RepID=A0AA96YBT1_9CYAN|nr:hypothetical protein [Thermoleptolyngbya oregonensis]WOB45498.1 hypothetical protein HNI00_21950 [Thermoleptolyngbya oregonensis NK1-22]